MGFFKAPNTRVCAKCEEPMSELTEDELVRNYVKWAKQNAIPIDECSSDEIEGYMMRFLTAAG